MSWPYSCYPTKDGNEPLPPGWYWERRERGLSWIAHNGEGGSVSGPGMMTICVEVWMRYANKLRRERDAALATIKALGGEE